MSPIHQLIESLDDDDAIERRVAVADLVDLGREATPALFQALSDPRPRVRWGAAKALGKLGAGDRAAISALTQSLGDPVADVGTCAASSLLLIGSKAIPSLVTLLDSSDAQTLSNAVTTLGKFGQAASAAVPGLIRCLSTDNPTLQAEAAVALGRMGYAAEPAVPTLLPLLLTTDACLRRAVAIAVGLIGFPDTPALLTGLRKCFTDCNYRLAEAIVIALCERGAAHEAFFDLEKAVVVGDDDLQREAMIGIRAVDPHAQIRRNGGRMTLTCHLTGDLAAEAVRRMMSKEPEQDSAVEELS